MSTAHFQTWPRCTVFILHSTSHLPLVLRWLALELDEPVLLAVAHSTVVHGDDDGPSQQGPGGSTAHHRTQHCLSVFHWGPVGAKRITHVCCLVNMCQISQCMCDMAKLKGLKTVLGHWSSVPQIVLPLNCYIHLIHSALRNGPCWY